MSSPGSRNGADEQGQDRDPRAPKGPEGPEGPEGAGGPERSKGSAGKRGQEGALGRRGCLGGLLRVLVRWGLPLLVLYMAAGYLTTAIRRVEDVQPAPAPRVPLPSRAGPLLTGVYSVHTGRSHDALGTREQVASAAREADLDFVVVGDHPRDDRRPDWRIWEPRFLEGVLVVGGQEIRSPRAGKVLALGVDSTYKRWQGEYDSFLAFLEREEATAFVVHGRGPRESERWVQPTVEGMHGWEILDISEFARHRLEGPWNVYHLITLLGGLPFGWGDEALLHTLREGFDTPSVAAYDSLRLTQELTATAGLNVHPKMEVGPLLFPPYGPFFRTLRAHVTVPGAGLPALPSDPGRARDLVARVSRAGNLFLALGDDPGGSRFRFAAVQKGGEAEGSGDDGRDAGDETVPGDPSGVVRMGGVGPFRPGASVLRAGFAHSEESGETARLGREGPPEDAHGGPGTRLLYRVVRNGVDVAWLAGASLEWPVPDPGVYRVEVYRYTARIGDTFFRLRPWIFSNPLELTGESPVADLP